MANPTTNYSFVLPTSSDLVTDLPADFDVALQGVDTRLKALQPGTTAGDLAYSSATANTNVRLGIGTSGQVLGISAGAPAWVTPTDIVGTNPNLVINGNFTINQRGYVSAASLASGNYGFDRWKSNFTSTTLTYTSAPAGQSVTINSGGGLQQIVEQGNVPAGTYVLSFAGTATGRVYNSGAASPPSYAASPITFTADGSANVVVEFTAVSTTKTLSKVKLELASAATAFSYAGGTLQGELAACQRYYWRTSSAQEYANHAIGFCATTTSAIFVVNMPVAMRVKPTVFDYSTLRVYDGNADFTPSSVTQTNYYGSSTSVGISAAITGATQYRPALLLNSNSTAGYIGFGAEL